MSAMTDIEMTRLCAEAMGIAHQVSSNNSFVARMDHPTQGFNGMYDPLHDDAQAMALVKKLRMTITIGSDNYWGAVCGARTAWTDNDDLNRAIVECVAQLQKEKT